MSNKRRRLAAVSEAHLEPAVPLHWPGTESASVVLTNPLREVRAALNTLVSDGGVVIVDGSPGLGKTFATNLVLQSLSVAKYWIAMPDKPRGKETTARVNEVLTGRQPEMRRWTEFELLEHNVELLANRYVALVIDEAQHLLTGSLRQLRYLYDRPETSLLLVLVGARVEAAVARRCPELYSRVERMVGFKPMSAAEMREALGNYHPLFANSTPSALKVCWSAAGGEWRGWAKLLRAALAMNVSESGMSVAEARAVCRAVYGETRRPPESRNGGRGEWPS